MATAAKTLFERLRPREADALRVEVGGLFVGETKKLAHAGGFSARRARQVIEGEISAVTSRFFLLLRSLPLAGMSPHRLVNKAKIVATESLLEMDAKQLSKLFWKLLEEEAAFEGEGNRATQTFARNGDLGALAESSEKESSLAGELSAVTSLLIKLGIDPREYK
jgi:hypothetical protein